MPYTKVKVGKGDPKTDVRFWVDGTVDEVVAKITGRFKVYRERPSRAGTTQKTESEPQKNTTAPAKLPVPPTGKKATTKETVAA